MRRRSSQQPKDVQQPAGALLTWLLDDFEEVDHVRMVDVLENLDLARHALDVALVGDAILLQHLDSYPLAREQMHAELDLAKRPFADGLRE